MSTELDPGEGRERLRRVTRLAASILALAFILSVTAGRLAVFSGPSLQLLRQSWELAGEPIVEEARPAVVQVYRGAAGSGSSRGSGFNVAAEGIIVTNRHLVQGSGPVRVFFPREGAFPISRIYVCRQADLAVLVLEGGRDNNLPLLSLAAGPPYAGEELFLIGNPLQYVRLASRGVLLGYRENPHGGEPYLVVEAPVYPGSSGSPLLNDRGEVAGVIFATLGGDEPDMVRGLAVDVVEVRRFLGELAAAGEIDLPPQP